MPRAINGNHRVVTIKHRIRSDELDQRQELKEEILPGRIAEHYNEVDFTDSVDNAQVMWNFLFRKYKVKFTKSSLRRHFGKIEKQILRNRATMRYLEMVRRRKE